MTSIEWTDRVWNPTVGCSRVSAGCDHCYAMHVAHRGLRPEHAGLTKLRPRDHSRPGVDWTGEVRTLPERLAVPLRWRKPSRVFVDSMSDLFHHAIPFEFIAAVFGIMAATPQHTYQVLTKRPARAREFFALLGHEPRKWPGETDAAIAVRYAEGYVGPLGAPDVWPLPNVWLGTSVEDQATADARVPELLRCSAAVRFLSYEPALGPVDFKNIAPSTNEIMLALSGLTWRVSPSSTRVSATHPKLDWIIVGGESGNGARPFDVAWARSVITQARGTGCRVFVKQLGAAPAIFVAPTGAPDDGGDMLPMLLADPKGGDPAEWPEDLRVREMPTRTERT